MSARRFGPPPVPSAGSVSLSRRAPPPVPLGGSASVDSLSRAPPPVPSVGRRPPPVPSPTASLSSSPPPIAAAEDGLSSLHMQRPSMSLPQAQSADAISVQVSALPARFAALPPPASSQSGQLVQGTASEMGGRFAFKSNLPPAPHHTGCAKSYPGGNKGSISPSISSVVGAELKPPRPIGQPPPQRSDLTQAVAASLRGEDAQFPISDESAVNVVASLIAPTDTHSRVPSADSSHLGVSAASNIGDVSPRYRAPPPVPGATAAGLQRSSIAAGGLGPPSGAPLPASRRGPSPGGPRRAPPMRARSPPPVPRAGPPTRGPPIPIPVAAPSTETPAMSSSGPPALVGRPPPTIGGRAPPIPRRPPPVRAGVAGPPMGRGPRGPRRGPPIPAAAGASSGSDIDSQIADLKQQLQDAISSHQFEKCVGLRDKIGALEQQKA